MIRITKITDYGITVLSALASQPEAKPRNAREIAAATHLPAPTVSKILGVCTRANLLTSLRGANGGYTLARSPESISVADIIVAFEGPLALTECLSHEAPDCDVESVCPTRSNWHRINAAIRKSLEEIPLSEMAIPQRGWQARMGAALVSVEGLAPGGTGVTQ